MADAPLHPEHGTPTSPAGDAPTRDSNDDTGVYAPAADLMHDEPTRTQARETSLIAPTAPPGQETPSPWDNPTRPLKPNELVAPLPLPEEATTAEPPWTGASAAEQAQRQAHVVHDAPIAPSSIDDEPTVAYFGTPSEDEGEVPHMRAPRRSRPHQPPPAAGPALDQETLHREDVAAAVAPPHQTPSPVEGVRGPPTEQGLPVLKHQQAKRKLTLIGGLMPEMDAPMRARWPYMAVFLLLVVGVGGAWVFRRALAEIRARRLAPPPVAQLQLSGRDEAQVEFARGVKAFNAKDLAQAQQAFLAALAKDPSFGLAHRSLGIIKALHKEHAKAVEHYKQYLVLTPNAPDKAQVEKIIADYERSLAPDAATQPHRKGARPLHKPPRGRRGARP